eukprot:1193830-Amorphochlora_amoeboformis.AAC.1
MYIDPQTHIYNPKNPNKYISEPRQDLRESGSVEGLRMKSPLPGCRRGYWTLRDGTAETRKVQGEGV